MASVGTAGWALQGVIVGANNASAEVEFSRDAPSLIDSISFSGRLSQDTMASFAFDVGSIVSPYPNLAAGISTMGALYDGLRNPAPSYICTIL